MAKKKKKKCVSKKEVKEIVHTRLAEMGLGVFFLVIAGVSFYSVFKVGDIPVELLEAIATLFIIGISIVFLIFAICMFSSSD